ncbi:MAG TPA: peptidylprolyl isomerase [Caulobacteraceae bacterium]|nr:peptidylprolyl isomerase [Caulobacteraceae bacterium]
MRTVLLAAALALAAVAAQAGSGDWRRLDPELLWVIDTNKGRVVVELRPELAPNAVERIRLLTRERLYDGLLFHRVIDGFMAQTGDPGNVDSGRSSHPDLKAEFTFRRGPETPFVPVAAPAGAVVGFVGAVPVQTQPDSHFTRSADGKGAGWGLYCPGVVGMGRGDDPDSANAEFFLMREAYPSLDKRYTVVGRVVSGLDVVRSLKTGEPVIDADRMVRVRMASELPDAERPRIEVMDAAGPAFQAKVAAAKRRKGADFSICDLDIPTRTR